MATATIKKQLKKLHTAADNLYKDYQKKMKTISARAEVLLESAEKKKVSGVRKRIAKIK